jgi:hypothetical protein
MMRSLVRAVLSPHDELSHSFFHSIPLFSSPYKGISVHIPLGSKSGGNSDAHSASRSDSKPTGGRGDPARTCVVSWHGYLSGGSVGLAMDLERSAGGGYEC